MGKQSESASLYLFWAEIEEWRAGASLDMNRGSKYNAYHLVNSPRILTRSLICSVNLANDLTHLDSFSWDDDRIRQVEKGTELGFGSTRCRAGLSEKSKPQLFNRLEESCQNRHPFQADWNSRCH